MRPGSTQNANASVIALRRLGAHTARREWARSGPGQRGAVLLLALVMLIAMLIIGVASARMAVEVEKSAHAERDRQVAFEAAEAALADAERDIEGGVDPASGRAALFASGSSVGFVAGCGDGKGSDNLGLCLPSANGSVPVWQNVDLRADGGVTVPYGHYTGALLPSGAGGLPARAPRYLIEVMSLSLAGEDASTPPGNFYRISAIGFGPRATSYVVLQSFYRKLDPDGARP